MHPHPTRLDIAHVCGTQLLLYGWVLGLENSVARATVQCGALRVDLLSQAVRLSRPDVSSHFAGDERFWNDAHGFYLLVDVPGPMGFESVELTITLHSDHTTTTSWQVSRSATGELAAMQQHTALIEALLAQLPAHESERLRHFITPTPDTPAAAAALVHPRLRSGLDICCLLENRLLLVCGWLLDPAGELQALQLDCGPARYDVLSGAIRTQRPDVLTSLGAAAAWTRPPKLPGFVFVQPLTAEAHGEVKLDASSRTGHLRLSAPLSLKALDSRRSLFSHLEKLNPDMALTVIMPILTALNDSIEERALAGQLDSFCDHLARRLPLSLQHTQPRIDFHIDQAIEIGDQGVFLVGWCYASPGSIARVTCHRGRASVDIGGSWVRHPRPDVTGFLTAAAVPCSGNDHGYSCFVPLPRGNGSYFIGITLTSGETVRVAVSLGNEPRAIKEAIRSILSSFSSVHPELIQLLDRHVGPAVGALWSARYKPRTPPLVRHFGPQHSSAPALSIIVPLFGRHDLAEYQLALFADDPQIQAAELIYIVDDPTIAREFSALCSDLYGIYKVPFTVVDPGWNLGFAGANNCAARVARGDYLLLLNSDVLPRRPGWSAELLQLYRSHPDTGLLGAKLLYEDGSVQHVGMTFRRHADWGGLWINHHPLKGQSGVGLTGIRQPDAVTAACVLVEAALFQQLGGFSEDYIIGDFEDSDLCLRARALGRVNRVALDTELFHLERQSQNRVGDNVWRTNLTLYNCWLHNRRWSSAMEEHP